MKGTNYASKGNSVHKIAYLVTSDYLILPANFTQAALSQAAQGGV